MVQTTHSIHKGDHLAADTGTSANSLRDHRNSPGTILGRVLAFLICLWIAWCTSVGPIYRRSGSMAEFGWQNALILLCALAVCLGLVALVRHLLYGGESPLSMLRRSDGAVGRAIGKLRASLSERKRLRSAGRAYRSFIMRETRGWKPIMRLLVIGWSWALVTLLAAYGADLYAQIAECSNWILQLRGDVPQYGGNAFTQMDVYPIGHYLWPSEPTFLTDQHNLVLTFFYGMTALASQRLTGSYDAGIVLLAGLQLVFGAFCCSVTANRFFTGGHPDDSSCRMNTAVTDPDAYRAGPLARTLVILFFLICPFNVFSSISLTKSPLFAFSFVWWFGIWYQAIRQDGAGNHPFASPRTLVGLAVSTLIMLISAKYGIYIVIAQIVLALIMLRRYWKTYLICLLLPAMAFTALVSGLEGAGHVIKGDPIESKSIQLQQVARVARVDPSGIDSQTRQDLDPILDLDSAASNYTPWEADRVKSSGNQPKLIVYKWRTVTDDQMKKFNKAWLNLAKGHAVPYLDALMAECYGYFDVNDSAYVAMSYYLNNSYVQESSTWIQYWCRDWRNGVTGAARTWASIPVLGWIAQGNFWVTLGLILIAAWLSAGRWHHLLEFLPLLLIMGVMVTAPANNFERHMLPVAMVVPFLILAMSCERRHVLAGANQDDCSPDREGTRRN